MKIIFSTLLTTAAASTALEEVSKGVQSRVKSAAKTRSFFPSLGWSSKSKQQQDFDFKMSKKSPTILLGNEYSDESTCKKKYQDSVAYFPVRQDFGHVQKNLRDLESSKFEYDWKQNWIFSTSSEDLKYSKIERIVAGKERLELLQQKRIKKYINDFRRQARLLGDDEDAIDDVARVASDNINGEMKRLAKKYAKKGVVTFLVAPRAVGLSSTLQLPNAAKLKLPKVTDTDKKFGAILRSAQMMLACAERRHQTSWRFTTDTDGRKGANALDWFMDSADGCKYPFSIYQFVEYMKESSTFTPESVSEIAQRVTERTMKVAEELAGKDNWFKKHARYYGDEVQSEWMEHLRNMREKEADGTGNNFVAYSAKHGNIDEAQVHKVAVAVRDPITFYESEFDHENAQTDLGTNTTFLRHVVENFVIFDKNNGSGTAVADIKDSEGLYGKGEYLNQKNTGPYEGKSSNEKIQKFFDHFQNGRYIERIYLRDETPTNERYITHYANSDPEFFMLFNADTEVYNVAKAREQAREHHGTEFNIMDDILSRLDDGHKSVHVVWTTWGKSVLLQVPVSVSDHNRDLVSALMDLKPDPAPVAEQVETVSIDQAVQQSEPEGWSVGAFAGDRKSGQFFVGHQGDNFLYLDPHSSGVQQSTIDRNHDSFRAPAPFIMPKAKLPKKMVLGFFVKDAADFKAFIKKFNETLGSHPLQKQNVVYDAIKKWRTGCTFRTALSSSIKTIRSGDPFFEKRLGEYYVKSIQPAMISRIKTKIKGKDAKKAADEYLQTLQKHEGWLVRSTLTDDCGFLTTRIIEQQGDADFPEISLVPAIARVTETKEEALTEHMKEEIEKIRAQVEKNAKESTDILTNDDRN